MRPGRGANLTIGHLQVGPSEHGICRHGRLLAAEGRRRADVRILERSIQLSGQRRADRQQLEAVAGELSEADLVHLQVSVAGDTTWGRNGRSLANLRVFRRHCRAPLAVTLHDVNNLRSLECHSAAGVLWRAALELAKSPLRPAVRLARQLRGGRVQIAEAFRSVTHLDPFYAYRVARWVTLRAHLVLVASSGEVATLRTFGITRKVTMIPLPVEDAPTGGASPAGPGAGKTVILAGFIFQSKGYDLMIKALALLPDVKLVLVGGPRLGTAGSHTSSRLMSLAKETGVADRVHMTGYLPDEEYLRHLAAADLAVCPFEADKSASASLSSLIAAGCPVLASDTPIIAEYNAIAPAALATFSPYTPEALARAISEALRKPRSERSHGLAELRERLSVRQVYARHLESYRQVYESR